MSPRAAEFFTLGTVSGDFDVTPAPRASDRVSGTPAKPGVPDTATSSYPTSGRATAIACVTAVGACGGSNVLPSTEM